jgi:hypothetical protein
MPSLEFLAMMFAAGGAILLYLSAANANKRIADAQTRAATLELEAAKLRETTVKLQLDLEKERAINLATEQRAANRDLTPDQIKTASSKLIEFSGQRAVIVEFPVNFEHDFIANSILAVLSEAHWNYGPVNRLTSPPDDMLVQGIWVKATADERNQAAARALFDALKTTVASGGFDPSPLSDPNVPRVWIYVGDKPTPLRSWVKP